MQEKAEWIWTLHIWQTQAYKLVEVYIFSPCFIVEENREILDTVFNYILVMSFC